MTNLDKMRLAYKVVCFISASSYIVDACYSNYVYDRYDSDGCPGFDEVPISTYINISFQVFVGVRIYEGPGNDVLNLPVKVNIMILMK